MNSTLYSEIQQQARETGRDFSALSGPLKNFSFRNLLSNWILLLSAAVFLYLSVSADKTVLAIAALYVPVMLLIAGLHHNLLKQSLHCSRPVCIFSGAASILLGIRLQSEFLNKLAESPGLQELAARLPDCGCILRPLPLSTACAVLTVPLIYTGLVFMEPMTARFLREDRKWHLPLKLLTAFSAMCFLQMNTYDPVVWITGSAVVLALILFVPERFWIDALKIKPYFLCFLLLSAIGICFKLAWIIRGTGYAYFPGFLALPFVFTALALFWCNLRKCLNDIRLFSVIRKSDIVTCSVITLLLTGLCAVMFYSSDAFYNSGGYDTIYTSDSHDLMHPNVFIYIPHSQNDIRQPLFAVFAAPFSGPAAAISCFINAGTGVEAFIVNALQIPLLIFANLLLALLLGIPPRNRIFFIVLSSCTYSTLLFSQMIEQYIIGYFYLILLLGTIRRKVFSPLAVCAAGGTLLTSFALLPLCGRGKTILTYILSLAGICICFGILLLVFERSNVYMIPDLYRNIKLLRQFAGGEVTFCDKLLQYCMFIKGCFAAPGSGAVILRGQYTWQQLPVQNISWTGLVLPFLALVSVYLNRKNIFALIAGGWIAFSLVILVILGWGTAENGLILYSLYFGWAYLFLLYQLFMYAGKKWKKRWLVPALSCIFSAVLLYVNIPAVIKIFQFALQYYPV